MIRPVQPPVEPPPPPHEPEIEFLAALARRALTALRAALFIAGIVAFAVTVQRITGTDDEPLPARIAHNLLWAAVGRFGPAHAAAPAVPSGKDFLIRHTAALLHGGGHDGHALRRYLATTIQAVAVKLHAPRDLGPTNLRHWLERVRASRHVTITLPDLEREVAEVAATPRPPPRRLVELAARIHRWRTEMTHGSDHRP